MNKNAVAGPSRSAVQHGTLVTNNRTSGAGASTVSVLAEKARLRPPRKFRPRVDDSRAGGSERYARVGQSHAAARIARIMLTVTQSVSATSTLSHAGHVSSASLKGKARAMDPAPTAQRLLRRQDSPISLDGLDKDKGDRSATPPTQSSEGADSSNVGLLSAGASSVPLISDGTTALSLTASQASSSSFLLPPMSSSSSPSITAATTAAVQSLAPASLIQNAAASTASNDAEGAAPHVSIKHNLPLQLLITVGALVVFASLLASSAWLCRTRLPCTRKRRKRRDKTTWSPAAGSTESFDVKSVDARQWAAKYAQTPMLLKDDVQRFAAAPAVPTDAELQRPAPCAMIATSNQPCDQQFGQRGYQLWDAPMPSAPRQSPSDVPTTWQGMVDGGGGNYAAGAAMTWTPNASDRANAEDRFGELHSLPPARRPSFIERLLVARPNSAGLPDVLRGDEEQRISNPHQSTTDDLLPSATQLHETFIDPPDKSQRQVQQPPATRSATLLSTVLSTLGVHQNANFKRPQKHARDLDSDFEGTIGAKDVELPMARRVGKRESRFPCDISSDEDSAATLAIISRARKTLDASGEPYSSTPRTPGLAGLGSAWARVAPLAAATKRPSPLGPLCVIPPAISAPSVPAPAARAGAALGGRTITLSELKLLQSQKDLGHVLSPASNNRHKLESTVARWLTVSRYADLVQQTPLATQGALPRMPRRRDSAHSLTQSEGSSMTLASSDQGLSRMPSIVPRFGATTTLESWLEKDPIKGDSSDAGVNELVNILGMYSMGDGASTAGSESLSLADVPPKRPLEASAGGATPMISLPTGDSILPPSYRSFGTAERLQREETKSSNGSSRSRTQTWSQSNEALEEEKRQVDRRQKLHRKEQRRSARMQARHLALSQEAEAQQATQAASVEEAQDRRHTILDFAMLTAGQSPRVGVTRSRSLASSVYSNNTAPSEYCNAPILSNPATVNRLSVIQEHKSPSSQESQAEQAVAAPSPQSAIEAKATLHVPVQKRRVSSARLMAPLSPPDSPWTSPDSRTGPNNGRWQGGPQRPRDSFIVPKRSAATSANAALPSDRRELLEKKRQASKSQRDVIPPTGHLVDVAPGTGGHHKDARRVVSALPTKQAMRSQGARRDRVVSEKAILA
ncbi:hypothetical protein CBOM_02982 [Ceraceosorus bombacis]|uniref:Uncharacterized protein n=1 Tax=Ceraceosorus bombacis TaxID=401625 RepID=A0A0P1BKP3_9BASI|nr:hypothetical protein CBOM_02982 [Ceraceosorus bombacis]